MNRKIFIANFLNVLSFISSLNCIHSSESVSIQLLSSTDSFQNYKDNKVKYIYIHIYMYTYTYIYIKFQFYKLQRRHLLPLYSNELFSS